MIGGQKQSGGDHSLNVQGNTVYVGLSLEQVRTVALGVFRENFLELQGIARSVVEERVEKLTDDVLRRIAAENPELLQRFSNPSSAHAMFQAQKSAALAGEEELSDTLSDLVIEHLSEHTRTRRQIAIAQAIDVTAFLTVRQIDILLVHFLTTRAAPAGIINRRDLLARYALHFSPLAERLRDATPEDVNTEVPYLEYHRCLSVRAGKHVKYGNPRDKYSALFCKGFSFDGSDGFAEKYSLSNDERSKVLSLLMSSPDDPAKVQLRGLDIAERERILQQAALRFEIKSGLLTSTNEALFTYDETRMFLENNAPDAAFLFRLCYDSELVSGEMTPTGVAIAHSAAKRLLSLDAPLEVWLR